MRIVAAVAALAMLAGCAGNEYGGGFNKTTGGTLLGAAGGGLLGAQFGKGNGRLAAVAAGVLGGALIGHEAGRSLDRADAVYASQAQYRAQAAPVGQTIAWDNPETGNRGWVTPTREGQNTATGEYCREFQQTIQVGGQVERGYGTACRQPDGSWRVAQ